MQTWDMIDTVDHLKETNLLLSISSINIKNQELFKSMDKFVFAVLKQACLKCRFHLACSRHGLCGRCSYYNLEYTYMMMTFTISSVGQVDEDEIETLLNFKIFLSCR